MILEADPEAPPYHLSLPEWPTLGFGDESVDGLIPTCRVKNRRQFEVALGHRLMNPPGVEFIYRGQRRQEWQLTPTLGRYGAAGVVDVKRAEDQYREFRLAMRGRGIGVDLLGDETELWAYGQHHGLATPLLDWTKSPFVALFFAFADPDLIYEAPNHSRAIFVINKTALDALDPMLIVQPMRNDHSRLVNQAGLFTQSPVGSDTLVTRIFNLLSDTQTVDMDDPAEVGRFIFKMHIPNEERGECLSMLRKMNIHHGSLFPDPIGASLYCNEWFGGRVDEAETDAPVIVRKTAAPRKPPPSHPRPRKPGLSEVANLGPPPSGTLEKALGALLRNLGLERSHATKLADALVAKFEATAPIDWTGRPFGSASVSVEVKRILRMNGVDPERVELVASAVFKMLQEYSSTTQKSRDKTDTKP